MAIQTALLSFGILDATGVVKSFPDYLSYDDAVATLSSLVTYCQATAVLLDAVTEGKLVSIGLTLNVALPGGLKANPVAGSDVEETGLITYTTEVSGRSWGEDIPAFIQSAFVGKNINQADTDVQAWTNHQANAALAARAHADNYIWVFTGIKRARKTFRKSRRALNRA